MLPRVKASLILGRLLIFH